MTTQLPGTWQEPHREIPFPPQTARKLWTEQAIVKLESVASTYGGCITYQDLGDHLFEATQVRTTSLLHRWISNPLFDVLDHCIERDMPAITALVVQKGTGRVGPGFNAWLRRQNRGPVGDPDVLEALAAQERLASYRRYCADVPGDAVPMPTPRLAKKVNSGKIEWPWTSPPCSDCGRPLEFYESCSHCS